MMMIIIIMIIASYIMVMIIIILTTSYIGDDVRIVYALANTMRYFLVTNKGILGVGFLMIIYLVFWMAYFVVRMVFLVIGKSYFILCIKFCSK